MCITSPVFLKYLEIDPTSVQFSAKASSRFTQTKEENKNHPKTICLLSEKVNQYIKNVNQQKQYKTLKVNKNRKKNFILLRILLKAVKRNGKLNIA